MAGRADIQAGSASVRLWVNKSDFVKGLKSAGQTLTSWGKNISTVGASISAIGASITGPLIAAAAHFASSGDEINKMSQRTGASVEALSQLRYVADQSGVSIGELEGGFKHMGKSIDEARQGSKEARETLARLGISMEELNEPPDAQMELFADRLAAIQDPSERAALAMKIFGKSGTSLLPMFADGAKGIRELRTEAVRMGQSFGQEEADAATNLGDAWEDVKKVLQGAAFAIGGALAPTMTDLLLIVKEGAITVSNFIRNNKELIITAAKIAVGISILGAAITAVGVGFMAAGAVLSGFATTAATVAAGISTLVGIMISGPGLIAAAIIGGVTAWAMFTESGQSAVSSLMESFGELMQFGKDAWGGIVDALMAGDLALAGEIAVAALNLVWQKAVGAFQTAWSDIKFWFTSIWAEATTSIATFFVDAFAGIESAWVAMTAFMESTFLALKTSIMNGWQSMQKGIGDAIISAAEKSGAVSSEFAEAWRQSLAAPIESDIAGRTAQANSRQAEIEARRKSSLAAIEAGAKGTRNILEQDKNRAQTAAFNAQDTTGNQAAISEARARFNQGRLDAAEAASAAKIAAAEKKKKETQEPITAPTVTGAATTGTFSAAAALAVGAGGGVQERIAKAAEEQKKLQEKAQEQFVAMVSWLSQMAKGLTHP